MISTGFGGKMKTEITPVVIAFPIQAAYRSHPEHQSDGKAFESVILSARMTQMGCFRTFARASASGMSLSASLVKSFSGFNKASDMMAVVGKVLRLNLTLPMKSNRIHN